MKRIDIKTFSWQGLTYRIFVIAVNAVFFKVGAKQAMQSFGAIGTSLIWNSINMCLYFLYHTIFLKLFSLRVETKGAVVWFTGIPCSGKTTIADEVAKKLKLQGKSVERLDGDVVRKEKLSDDLGFSKLDRDKNISRVCFVAKILSRNNVIVLSSFVSPYRSVRSDIRKEVTNFIEVHVCCSSTICAVRDVKGMYEKARKGLIKGFTGYDASYEEPQNPEVVCNTEVESIEQSTDKVMDYLTREKII